MSLKAITFLLGIILARLLMPEDFGLLAVVNVFYLLVTLFVDGGLKEALIQKKDATEVHYSTVFWLNLIFGILLYSILFILAPLIQNYYEYEDLAFYIRLQSFTLILESLGIVQIAKATKELNLKKITKARIPASLFSFVVGIFMAYHGFGILSLIVQQLLNVSFYVILLLLFVKYRPKFLFDIKEAKDLYRFGVKILMMALLSRFYVQALNLLYAKFYSPALLGLYNKSYAIQNTPIEIINSSFMRGVYPTMVFLQDDNNRLKELYLTNIKILTYIMLFLNGILFFNATEIINFLLGSHWMNSVIYLKIVAVGSLFVPIAVQSQNIFKIRNNLDIFLKIEFINKIISLVVVFIFISKISLPSLLIFVLAFNFIFSLFCFYLVSRSIHFAFYLEIFGILLRYFILAIIGYFINLMLNNLFDLDNLFKIIMFGIIYSICFAIILIAIDRKTFILIKEKLSK